MLILEVDLDPDLAQQLAESASRRSITKEDVVVQALREYIGEWLSRRAQGEFKSGDGDG